MPREHKCRTRRLKRKNQTEKKGKVENYKKRKKNIKNKNDLILL
jgi:hypothetical protein